LMYRMRLAGKNAMDVLFTIFDKVDWVFTRHLEINAIRCIKKQWFFVGMLKTVFSLPSDLLLFCPGLWDG
jgi:hypothetical protein